MYELRSKSKEWKQSPLELGIRGALFVENLKAIKLMKNHLLFIFSMKVNNYSDRILLSIGQILLLPYPLNTIAHVSSKILHIHCG